MSVQPAATHKMIIPVHDGYRPFDRSIVQTGFDPRQSIVHQPSRAAGLEEIHKYELQKAAITTNVFSRQSDLNSAK
jgi:hypothetical protein